MLRVRELAEPIAERRGGTVRVDQPATPCMAEVDARRVERIVRNLVLNAVEHGEGRPVEVTLRSDADAIALRVRDHGVGLAPGEADRVFDRFWRADPARARSTGGTGLGLAISLEDAHLHGGTLLAWGRPGEGAAFLLTLPRRAGARLVGSPLRLADPDETSTPAYPGPGHRPGPGPGSGTGPGSGNGPGPGTGPRADPGPGADPRGRQDVGAPADVGAPPRERSGDGRG